MNTPDRPVGALACPAVAAAVFLALACSSEPTPVASARMIKSRSQLVGGDRALGDIGDFLLENDQIRVVIQSPGYSRGFGVYGGSLIDADLRRPGDQGNSGAGVGRDTFGELFPSFFVQAVGVDKVRVLRGGADGRPAQVEASGTAGDFLELAALLNRAITGSHKAFQSGDSERRLHYSTIYELAPSKRHVTIRFRVKNISNDTLEFPSEAAKNLLSFLNLTLDGFTVPLGDVALFGATSHVFIPGVGFDLRFGLERAYDQKVDWPAFPGFVGEFIASQGEGTSYGLITEESDQNYVYNKKEIYDDGKTPITKHSLFFPFVASSFVGVFHTDAPATLSPGKSFEVVKHFIVGSGDVGSVLDTIHEIRKVPVGSFGGQVLDRVTLAPVRGTSVLVYQRLSEDEDDRRIYSQYDVREDGYFGGTLEPGQYSLRVAGPSRPLSDFVDFSVSAGALTGLRVLSPPPGRILVRIVSSDGDPLPAKATAVGRYSAEHAGKPTRTFLFDLEAGESWRGADLVPDDPSDPDTRQYIEGTAFTKDGMAELLVKPGTYDVISSRGPEYDVQSSSITVDPGRTAHVTHVLHRVVDTTGWVAGDTHIHSRNSIDSSMDLDERVRALAAEGIEWAVSTDHNYVTDYAPYVARNDLNRWLHPMVGVEMTTLESGHFNGYPLRYQPGPVTHGSFGWVGEPPDVIFDRLRNLGRLGPERTIVQVNHPRSAIMGYYAQYLRNAFTHDEASSTLFGQLTAPSGPAFRDKDGNTTFSFKYDAIELGVWKTFWEIHHYRVPSVLPPGPLPDNIPPTGSILKTSKGDAAFPGVVDDWFNLLNLGYRYIGVGTGDSHDSGDEVGQFRTMLFLGEDAPSGLTDERIVTALNSRRAVVTNGPFIDFYVNDPEKGAMGQTIQDSDGKVVVSYEVKGAPWVSVGRVNIYRNGIIVESVKIDENRDLSTSPILDRVEIPLARGKDGSLVDSWFVVEAIGYRSLFPIIRTLEIPPLMLADAVATLAGPLGLSSDEHGALRPPMTFPVTPYAITNPVWVKQGSGKWQPPGLVPIEVQDQPQNDPHLQEGIYERYGTSSRVFPVRAESRLGDRLDLNRKVPLFFPRTDNLLDVRKTLSRFGHLGGHR
ncbi:MAG: PHP domain-containing protein [Deltaproteobacteria bacterium]|nr:PHP domain-containing protein [Deltaproteobacteria bacterium]